MSTVDGEQYHVPEQLVDQLVKGYDALSLEIKLLDEQRLQLENRLSWAKQQYLDALKRFRPEDASQDYRTFLDELDEAGNCEAEKRVGWLESAQQSSDPARKSRAYNIQRATDARDKIEYRQRASDAGPGVCIWNGRSADALDLGVEMEKDYTTYAGTPGRLKCPYVAPKKRTSLANVPLTNGVNDHHTPRGSSLSRGSMSGRRSKRSSFHDPIRAEICGNNPSVSSPPSVEDSLPLCPIRFLDQHSPEEVAKYFESHKHELPRSHETCVKRYQSNEESIKELDAKYGSLVGMITGLGQVHQPMLREVPDDEEAIEETDSKDRVQKWAASLQGADDEHDAAPTVEIDEERQPHFDRPLKDVRVGESPSRPWGITLPEAREDLTGVTTRSDHTASPRETPQLRQADDPAKPKCPFDHRNMKFNAMPHAPVEPEVVPEQPPPLPPMPPVESKPVQPPPLPTLAQSPAPQAQMVFNGPVFFGYTFEQTMALLQQNNLGKPS